MAARPARGDEDTVVRITVNQDDGVADLALNATSWSEYSSDSFSLRETGLRAVCPRQRCRPRGDRGPDLGLRVFGFRTLWCGSDGSTEGVRRFRGTKN